MRIVNEVERAYRRGYHQAIVALRRDIEAEYPALAKSMRDYEKYLYKWRLRQYRKDKFEAPYEFHEWLDSKRKPVVIVSQHAAERTPEANHA